MTRPRNMSPERERELLEHIKREVDKAPPLTDEQRARLAALLRPS